MKKWVLYILLLFVPFMGNSQDDTSRISYIDKNSSSENSLVNFSIFPVPVKENVFSVKSDKGVSYIKVTNIIGQDIFKIKYSEPQLLSYISLDNPKNGLYIVTIIFSDGKKIVKKITVENSE